MKTLQAVIGHLKSKTASYIALALAILLYHMIPGSWPFVELFYVGITILGAAVAGPLVRLLVFPEATHYAECGDFDKDMATTTTTNKLRHYWFATAVSYTLPVLCFMTVSK